MVLQSVLSSSADADVQQQISEFPVFTDDGIRTDADWLIDRRPFETQVYRDADSKEVILSNGIVSRHFRVTPAFATVALRTASGENLIRAVKPDSTVTLNGHAHPIGGFSGQPNHAFLLPEWLDTMSPFEDRFQLTSVEVGEPVERLRWNRDIRHHDQQSVWPPAGKRVSFHFTHPKWAGVDIHLHYELYDGVPVFCKSLQLINRSTKALEIDRFTAEQLAIVEAVNWVESRDGVDIPRPTSLHVETDFAFGGFHHENANRHVVHWRTDPEYSTQVNYLRKSPCLLVVEPTRGPAQTVAPGAEFPSFHTFELVHDSPDTTRRNLALRKMYRTVAPWVTENPLMMHMRDSDFGKVRAAIDQCAEVGFEMLILSFGSGFNVENQDPAYVDAWKEIREYGAKRGVEVGGYSLLSSRRIGDGNDIVSPDGEKPTHGNCPALTSPWGQAYFATLRSFFETTGFALLEHDGSYPGDVDVTPRPPLQKGVEDSRWVQWKIITDFYHWCRARGIYLNVPDYYFLSGANKCGMGYREVNWSLPRLQQVLHTRQNIFDGTRFKAPSMGWMFIPLTQYHGGGAAATVEPLSEHLDHYQSMIDSNLGAGVQACFRGPRLFDTEQTMQMVKSRVDWFKKHRGILESDVIHESSRRADGQDIDWLLHANPDLPECGMLVVYNPLPREVTKQLRLNLYYCGIEDRVEVTSSDGSVAKHQVDRQYRLKLDVSIPANGFAWYVFSK